MTSLLRSLGAKLLILLVLVPVLLLSACGSTSPTSGGSSGNGSASKGTVTVAGKLDPESQLITHMYTLLLQKAGFTVNEKLALGTTPTLFNALKSGAIDIYPEFTATGLNTLGIAPSGDPQKDYQNVKDGFEKQYQITWLDYSPLNDGYAICTSQTESAKLNVKTISDLAPQVSKLVLASPSDGISFIDALKKTYNFDTKSFKAVQKVEYSIGFSAVKSGQAQVNVCYTTDGSVTTQSFIFLNDDKNGFPQFHPAPIVRDSVLKQYPSIASTLNALAPKLTTDVSISLQQQVAQKKNGGMSVTQAVKEVATSFLQQQGLY